MLFSLCPDAISTDMFNFATDWKVWQGAGSFWLQVSLLCRLCLGSGVSELLPQSNSSNLSFRKSIVKTCAYHVWLLTWGVYKSYDLKKESSIAG